MSLFKAQIIWAQTDPPKKVLYVVIGLISETLVNVCFLFFMPTKQSRAQMTTRASSGNTSDSPTPRWLSLLSGCGLTV